MQGVWKTGIDMIVNHEVRGCVDVIDMISLYSHSLQPYVQVLSTQKLVSSIYPPD